MDAELGGGWVATTRPLRTGAASSSSCATRVVSLDDEAFVRDRAEWPSGSVCGV